MYARIVLFTNRNGNLGRRGEYAIVCVDWLIWKSNLEFIRDYGNFHGYITDRLKRQIYLVESKTEYFRFNAENVTVIVLKS